jgi:hypothetical protein
MSAYLLIVLGALLWLAVALLALGLCWAAKRGDADLERRLRDVSR